jgi:hypothetical protein
VNLNFTDGAEVFLVQVVEDAGATNCKKENTVKNVLSWVFVTSFRI